MARVSSFYGGAGGTRKTRAPPQVRRRNAYKAAHSKAEASGDSGFLGVAGAVAELYSCGITSTRVRGWGGELRGAPTEALVL